MNKSALVLFSGGLDSTIALVWAKTKFNPVSVITFDYGQANIKELKSAEKLPPLLGIHPHVVPLNFVKNLAGSELMGKDATNITGTSPFFVPLRNALFLTVAGMYAVQNNIHNIVIAVTREGWADCPDTKPNFLFSQEKTINQALGSYNINIVSPFGYWTKDQVLQKAIDMDCWDLLKYTKSCYRDTEAPCGTCEACAIRAKGFANIGKKDPAVGENLDLFNDGEFFKSIE